MPKRLLIFTLSITACIANTMYAGNGVSVSWRPPTFSNIHASNAIDAGKEEGAESSTTDTGKEEDAEGTITEEGVEATLGQLRKFNQETLQILYKNKNHQTNFDQNIFSILGSVDPIQRCIIKTALSAVCESIEGKVVTTIIVREAAYVLAQLATYDATAEAGTLDDDKISIGEVDYEDLQLWINDGN